MTCSLDYLLVPRKVGYWCIGPLEFGPIDLLHERMRKDFSVAPGSQAFSGVLSEQL